MVADDTRVVPRVYPVLAPLMCVEVNTLVLVVILIDPHILNNMGLYNIGHSARRDNPGLKIHVEVSVSSGSLNLLLKPSLNLLVVPSTERRLVVTHCKRDDEVVLVQVGVRSGGMKIVANYARLKSSGETILMIPVDGLGSGISQHNFHVSNAYILRERRVEASSRIVDFHIAGMPGAAVSVLSPCVFEVVVHFDLMPFVQQSHVDGLSADSIARDVSGRVVFVDWHFARIALPETS